MVAYITLKRDGAYSADVGSYIALKRDGAYGTDMGAYISLKGDSAYGAMSEDKRVMPSTP